MVLLEGYYGPYDPGAAPVPSLLNEEEGKVQEDNIIRVVASTVLSTSDSESSDS